MKYFESRVVKCPHYKHESAQVIFCEGVQKDCVTTINFANRTDAKEYKQTFCRCDYKNCAVCKMLERKV